MGTTPNNDIIIINMQDSELDKPRTVFMQDYRNFLKTQLYKPVVLKLGSTEPQGFGEAVAGVRLRSE